MIAPRLYAFGEIDTGVVQIFLRPALKERAQREVHVEERHHFVGITGHKQRVIGQARILPPITVSPTTEVGITLLFSCEDRSIEADRQLAASRTRTHITLPLPRNIAPRSFSAGVSNTSGSGPRSLAPTDNTKAPINATNHPRRTFGTIIC